MCNLCNRFVTPFSYQRGYTPNLNIAWDKIDFLCIVTSVTYLLLLKSIRNREYRTTIHTRIHTRIGYKGFFLSYGVTNAQNHYTYPKKSVTSEAVTNRVTFSFGGGK
jgi:hypothetical protein